MAAPAYTDLVTDISAYLDDQPKAWLTESFLLPLINSAQRTVVAHLIDNEVPTMRARSSAIKVSAGVTSLSAASLPTLLEAPMAVWEAAYGAAASEYRKLPGPFELDPAAIQQDFLGAWNWKGGSIVFIGCPGADRSIILDYVADLADFLNSGVEPIVIPAARNAIAYLTCGLVADSKGQHELANQWGVETPERLVTGRAGFALSTLINNQKAPEQGPVQRLPYITHRSRRW